MVIEVIVMKGKFELLLCTWGKLQGQQYFSDQEGTIVFALCD